MNPAHVAMALTILKARLELFGERLARERVPVSFVTEVAAIVQAVERLEGDLVKGI